MATTTLAQTSKQKNGNRPATSNTPALMNTVTTLLTKNFKAIASCLPKHLTPERMCRIATQTIQKTPALMKCSAESLVACIIEASSLGLEIDGRGLAYLVPYGSRSTLIFGYKGLMELAYRSGRVSNIYAETVCENDEFIFELGLNPKLEHRPDLEDRGELRAVYAVAKLKDADPIFVVLGRNDIEKIRGASKAGNSGPWTQWEEEMWKKSAIRRLCKYLPLSPEISRAVAIDEQADAGKPQMVADGIIDLPQEAYIDVEVSGQQANNQPEASQQPAPQRQTPPQKATRKETPETPPPPPTDEDDDDDAFYSTPDKGKDIADIECPNPLSDGSARYVSEATCMECNQRKGCPNWRSE